MALPLNESRFISLKGSALAWGLINFEKPIENRHVQLRGWRWLQISQNTIDEEQAAVVDAQCPWIRELPDLRGYIIGAVHFGGSMDVDTAKKDPRYAPWAFGPKCSLVTASIELDVPVRAKGTVNTGLQLPPEVWTEIKRQLETEPRG